MPVQINGKVRGHFMVPPGTGKALLEEQARTLEKIQPFLAGKPIAEVIVVPEKLVN